MDASVNLGKIWNIPIGLHPSWFLIFALLTWSLASGYFPGEYPNLPLEAHVIMGVLTSVLFFASVLGHELGHSYIALRSQIPVKGITLFIFGGVAQISQEPRTPGVEFRIAIAGPLVSLALSGFFGALWLLDQAIPFLAAPSNYLMRINFILAAFNIIPGFPLDGGRVLRAFVWQLTGSFQKATRVASFTGQLVALGFIGWGVFELFNGQFFNGLWLAFIGWFLQNAAASTYAQTNVQTALRGLRVAQVMEQDCPKVPSLLTINQLVEDYILTGGQRCFFVAENDKLRGMLTLRDITQVPKQKWRFTTTEQAMIPLQRLVHVSPNTEILAAMHIMDDANVNQVPVLSDGEELVGMLSREQVVHYLRTRSELGI
jgi:Zn-dependent protease/predicted transcriptional regulator